MRRPGACVASPGAGARHRCRLRRAAGRSGTDLHAGRRCLLHDRCSPPDARGAGLRTGRVIAILAGTANRQARTAATAHLVITAIGIITPPTLCFLGSRSLTRAVPPQTAAGSPSRRKPGSRWKHSVPRQRPSKVPWTADARWTCPTGPKAPAGARTSIHVPMEILCDGARDAHGEP